MKKIKNKNKGFTLIEVLVALAIFSIIIVLTMDIFVHSFISQRKLIEIQTVQREAAYLMESITRDIRMATAVTDQSPEAWHRNQDSSFFFQDRNGDGVEYCRTGNTGVCTDNDTGDYLAYGPQPINTKEIINSADVKIEYLKFYVSPEDLVNKDQPKVTVVMTLSSIKDPTVSITIQTTVAMRLYNS